MTDQTATGATELRKFIAKSIHQYDNAHALSGNDMPSEHHRGEADAVLEVIRPELAEREARITYWQTCRDNYAEENRQLIAERNALRAEVTAARKYAAEMRDFCSPHGVAVDYADQLEAAMDAKEGQA